MLRQVTIPCSKCGSYYRRKDYCNMCNSKELVPPIVEGHVVKKVDPPKGMEWSEEKRRFIPIRKNGK